MKIRIKNIGMLDEAEYEVGNLTLICGENNTGKTYATYSLYGYLDYMRSIQNIFSRKQNSLFGDHVGDKNTKELKQELTYKEILDKLKKHMKRKAEVYSNFILIENMAGKNEDFLNAKFDVEFDISLDDIKKATKEVRLKVEYKREVRRISDENGLTFFGLDGSDFDWYVEIFFNAMLRIIMMKNFILSVERTGASIFQEELDFIKIAKLETMQKILREEQDDFFEISEVLDRKKQLYPKPVRDNISFVRDIKRISKQESIFKKNRNEHKVLFGILDKLLGGKYKITDLGTMFQPKGSKKFYNTEVASSSVRSLLLLNYYIWHIAGENDILMIDEPELNLHPKNQILVARLLVLLVNAGVRVFITTHSDYIVREISNCIMLDNISDKQIDKFKKQGYSKEHKIKSDKIRAYLAKNIKGKNTLEKVEITQEQGIFIKTFDEPIESQNKNQGLIFEELMKHKRNNNDK